MLRTFMISVAFLATACSPPAMQEPAKTDTDMNMAETSTPAPAGPISAVGTVTAVDAAAGTISIDHEPIAAIAWPAMSMQFTAENPAILQGIAVGDRVNFELKSGTETSVIIALGAQ